ncbi:receptor protein [Trifolium repens]|nr:receptor protein [Trifolium repens]
MKCKVVFTNSLFIIKHNLCGSSINVAEKNVSLKVESIENAFAICLVDQQSLLIQLKNYLSFNPESSSKLKLRNSSFDCCDWNGVKCDSKGFVIGLDLSEESISGGFDNSSCLFSLQHLPKLNLADNNFNSLIPSGFRKLEKLRYLNLSYASFIGKIPIEISQLTIARNVLISNNNIVIEEYIYTSCPSLAQNKFCGPIECPATDDTWHMLQIIDLAFNNFSGKLPGKIFTRWEAMMSDNDQTESKINHIQFQVLQFGQIYYRIQ